MSSSFDRRANLNEKPSYQVTMGSEGNSRFRYGQTYLRKTGFGPAEQPTQFRVQEKNRNCMKLHVLVYCTESGKTIC